MNTFVYISLIIAYLMENITVLRLKIQFMLRLDKCHWEKSKVMLGVSKLTVLTIVNIKYSIE